ncbi:MAG: hypothetical protein ACRYFS_03585 [Janthinobacterium lividum]
MPTQTDVENMKRERDARLGPIEAARQSAALDTRQAQAGVVTSDPDGYYDDTTGTYVKYFQFGVSLFGDGSVLK